MSSNGGWSNLKPAKVPCPCMDTTCRIRTKPKPGKHADECICDNCENGNRRKRGLGAQVKVAKVFAVKGVSKSHPGNEEDWLGAVRLEVKSGPSECGPLINFYRRTRKQSDAAKAVGDSRIFVAGGVIDDMSVVLVRTADVPQFIYDAGQALGYFDSDF